MIPQRISISNINSDGIISNWHCVLRISIIGILLGIGSVLLLGIGTLVGTSVGARKNKMHILHGFTSMWSRTVARVRQKTIIDADIA